MKRIENDPFKCFIHGGGTLAVRLIKFHETFPSNEFPEMNYTF